MIKQLTLSLLVLGSLTLPSTAHAGAGSFIDFIVEHQPLRSKIDAHREEAPTLPATTCVAESTNRSSADLCSDQEVEPSALEWLLRLLD